MTKVYIGATSKSEKRASAVIKESFSAAAFPITLTIENLAPRDFSFPELGVPLLRNALSKTPGTKATVTVASLDVLKRAMSTVEQIAELNEYQVAIVLQEGKAKQDAPAAKPEEPAKGGKNKEPEAKPKDGGKGPAPKDKKE